MGTLLICLLAVGSVAAERAAKSSGAMAVRRANAQPSAMAVRRAGASPGAAPAPAAPSAPATPASPVPAASPAPDFHPRITPPTGSPTAGVDLRRHHGVRYAAPEPPPAEAPLAAVSGDGAVGAGSERAPAGVKGAAVTELKSGRTDRQFGGAQDPVLFLVGGTGPSGSVTSSTDGSNLSIQLGGQQR